MILCRLLWAFHPIGEYFGGSVDLLQADGYQRQLIETETQFVHPGRHICIPFDTIKEARFSFTGDILEEDDDNNNNVDIIYYHHLCVES